MKLFLSLSLSFLTHKNSIFIQSSFKNQEINRDKWREMTTKTTNKKADEGNKNFRNEVKFNYFLYKYKIIISRAVNKNKREREKERRKKYMSIYFLFSISGITIFWLFLCDFHILFFFFFSFSFFFMISFKYVVCRIKWLSSFVFQFVYSWLE